MDGGFYRGAMRGVRKRLSRRDKFLRRAEERGKQEDIKAFLKDGIDNAQVERTKTKRQVNEKTFCGEYK